MKGQNPLKAGTAGFMWLAHWIISPVLIELNIIFNFTLNIDDFIFIALFNLLTNNFLVEQVAPDYTRKPFFIFLE